MGEAHPSEATFRFHAELNDFLEPRQRGRAARYAFGGHPAVKDAIEALGVPHPEVEAIVVRDRAVDFAFRLEAGLEVHVHPPSTASRIGGAIRLREPLAAPRFVLDAHCGKLARLLRLLGFDALYRNDYDDPEIVRISVEEGRAALTRDRGILKHGALVHGYCLRSDVPEDQAREVLARFGLHDAVAPFSRCTACNDRLHDVAKAAVEHLLPPRTRREHDEFRRCTGCGRVYWKGSHHARLLPLLERLRR